MKRTRVLGGLLAASAALVAAVVLCLPASARQTGLDVIPSPPPSPKDVPPVLRPVDAPVPSPIQQTNTPPIWNGSSEATRLVAVPATSPAPVNSGAMSCTCVPAGEVATGTAKRPVAPKDATVDELIARLAELKAKEAELTDLLRTKLLVQQNGLKKLKKLGVAIEDENTAPIYPAPSSAVPSPVGPSAP